MKKLLIVMMLMLVVVKSVGAQTLRDKIDIQFHRSVQYLTENISPPGGLKGAVIASPSSANPDYYFDWVRDTALTMNSVLMLLQATDDPILKRNYEALMWQWARYERDRQSIQTLSGLGEPKYFVDGTAFNDPWGRPQNDGPALRSLVLIKFIHYLLNQSQWNEEFFEELLSMDSVILKDINYIVEKRDESSFDLWEEVQGKHFYTQLVQFESLVAYKKLSLLLRKKIEIRDLDKAIFFLKNELNKYFDAKNEFLIASWPSGGNAKNSNMDIAVVLGYLHTYPSDYFEINNPFLYKTVNNLINSFKSIYPINQGIIAGVAIGRYPEDRYDGYNTDSKGNPWFLATIALAEYYCLQKDNLELNSSKAQAQFERLLFHKDQEGRLSEQLSLYNGFQAGARDLTWSYSSYISAYLRCF